MASRREIQTVFERPGIVARLRLRVTRTGAGRRPQDVYREKARQWRRRNRRLVLSVPLIPLAFMGLVYLVFHPRSVSFLTGFGCGATAAMYIGVRELGVPDWIDRWRVGAEGERRTARQLRRLERCGWIVRHSVMTNRGDRDHIVVGPRGVFLLDSKAWRGQISVTDGALVVHHPGEERPGKPEPVAGVMTFRASELAQIIRAHVATMAKVNYTPFVQAVVVIWGKFPQVSVVSERVRFVHGDNLVTWLESEAPSVPIPDWLEHAVIDAVAEIAAGW